MSNLSILIWDGLDDTEMLSGELYAVLVTHGDVLLDGDRPVPPSVSLVKQLTQS